MKDEKQAIIEAMREEAPYHISDGIIPYISEAMEIYANKHISELRKPSEDIKQTIEDAAAKYAGISDDKFANSAKTYDAYNIDESFKNGAEFALRLSENNGQVDEPSSRSQENGAELLEAAKQILDLHVCEMEGLSSGQPTPTEWMNAVDKLSEAISNYEKQSK